MKSRNRCLRQFPATGVLLMHRSIVEKGRGGKGTVDGESTTDKKENGIYRKDKR